MGAVRWIEGTPTQGEGMVDSRFSCEGALTLGFVQIERHRK